MLHGLTFATLTLGFPLATSAQSLTEDTGSGPAHTFGHAGQLAISSDAALAISHTAPSEGSGVTNVTLAPAVDYFVIDGLSVGGFVSLDYTTIGDWDATEFGIGPRVGYNIELSDLVSVWPKIGMSFRSVSQSREVAQGDQSVAISNDSSGVALNLFAPIMFHPATHFFAGFGPFLDASLSGDNKATSVGARLTLGGWLGL